MYLYITWRRLLSVCGPDLLLRRRSQRSLRQDPGKPRRYPTLPPQLRFRSLRPTDGKQGKLNLEKDNGPRRTPSRRRSAPICSNAHRQVGKDPTPDGSRDECRVGLCDWSRPKPRGHTIHVLMVVLSSSVHANAGERPRRIPVRCRRSSLPRPRYRLARFRSAKGAATFLP